MKITEDDKKLLKYLDILKARAHGAEKGYLHRQKHSAAVPPH